MASSKEYYKQYRRGERSMKNDNRDDLVDSKTVIKFKSREIKLSQFKKIYKDKIKNKEQEYLFNICLDLIELIKSSKECLEVEGAFVKNCTGALKTNPAQKELRENLKAFTSTLTLLHDLTMTNSEEENLEGWLND